MQIISGLYNVGFDGLNRLGVLLGSIGVDEAWPCGKVSGLDQCGLDWETDGRMEVAEKCLNTREVVCAVVREQDI